MWPRNCIAPEVLRCLSVQAMCQPSPTIVGFLQQAEDNLALLRARAQLTPRKNRSKLVEDSPGSASARMSQQLRGTGSNHASPRPDEDLDELGVQARVVRDLDRKVRGFDARFKAMEKAVASAADLAAASSRCGRDGIEAATAATAAVRVEAEAKCRDLAQRIECLPSPKWTEELETRVENLVQACLNQDFQILERRLIAKFTKQASEVLEAAQHMTTELKAEVSWQLKALQHGCRTDSVPGLLREGSDLKALASVGNTEGLEGRLTHAEVDLQRALRQVQSLEHQAYVQPLQRLEERLGCLEAREASAANPPQEHRIAQLEADLAKLFQKLASTSSSIGVQDPRARPTARLAEPNLGIHGKVVEPAVETVLDRTLQPLELAKGARAGGGSGETWPEVLHVQADITSAPPAPPSPTSPLPSRPVVPFQPPSRRPTRPLLTVPPPGARRSAAATSGMAEVPVPESQSQAAAAGPSRDLWDTLLTGRSTDPGNQAGPDSPGYNETSTPAEKAVPAPHPSPATASGEQAGSNSSSPTLGSANLSDLLRSTSALADHRSASSHGSHGHSEDGHQASHERSPSGSSSGGDQRPAQDQQQAFHALARDAEEPICAFSTNVSEAEGFRSEDELDLPL
mmetsp:Transcript_12964/g.24514  ORF Transcript_12964/g.24514 Transcript_12964/m.24514 type:complete len:630 (+) Transcript_12964:1-1890(+)